MPPFYFHPLSFRVPRSHDDHYNSVDRLYVRTQGNSSRIRCPAFLFIKIHQIALSEAISLVDDDRDYYATDFSDLLLIIVEHMIVNDATGDRSIYDHPTPYQYLVAEILATIRDLFRDRIAADIDRIGRVGEQLITAWIESIAIVARNRGKMRVLFSLGVATDYLDLMSEIKAETDWWVRRKPHEFNVGVAETMASRLVERARHDPELRELWLDAVPKMDRGKRHVMHTQPWIEEKMKDLSSSKS